MAPRSSMTWGVKFGNCSNSSQSRVVDYFLHVVNRISMGRSVGAQQRHVWIFGRGVREALGVSQVPVEDVHLVVSHQIEIFEKNSDWQEVAR